MIFALVSTRAVTPLTRSTSPLAELHSHEVASTLVTALSAAPNPSTVSAVATSNTMTTVNVTIVPRLPDWEPPGGSTVSASTNCGSSSFTSAIA